MIDLSREPHTCDPDCPMHGDYVVGYDPAVGGDVIVWESPYGRSFPRTVTDDIYVMRVREIIERDIRNERERSDSDPKALVIISGV